MNFFTKIADKLIGSFGQLVSAIVDIIPNVVGAILILIVGVIVAKFVLKLVKELFKATKVDQFLERFHVESKVKEIGVDSKVTDILAGVIYWLVLLVFISAAVSILEVEVVTRFINQLIDFLPGIFAGLVIMVIGVMVAEVLARILERVRHGHTYKTVVRWFILVISFITAIEQIGLDVSFLTENIQIIVAGVSLAFGLAFGIGGKDKAKAFLDKHLR